MPEIRGRGRGGFIADLLRSSPVAARVRAGLCRAAADINGVRCAGEVRDELGRPGLAVELTEPSRRRRIVFDPRTSRMLVEQEVLTEPVPCIDADPGYRIVLGQAIVGSDRARPDRGRRRRHGVMTSLPRACPPTRRRIASGISASG